MNTTHTPGPWILGNNGNIYAPSHEFLIAKMFANGPTFGSCTATDCANARLIASAPELLEVVKMITRVKPDSDPVVMFAVIEKARAAITKAEGKE